MGEKWVKCCEEAGAGVSPKRYLKWDHVPRPFSLWPLWNINVVAQKRAIKRYQERKNG